MLEAGDKKSPQRVKCLCMEDYLYLFVALVLSATLPYEGEVIRHRCHNRKCIRPEHLQIGLPEKIGQMMQKEYMLAGWPEAAD
mgnify:FL=1